MQQRMAGRLQRARGRSVSTCNLALLLERRGKRQLEKSLRQLELGATSAYGKHVRRIKLLEMEHKEKLSNDVVSNFDRYFETKFNHLVGSHHRKNTVSPQLCGGLSDTHSQSVNVDICSGKKCLQFPCRREQTYHFMFDTSHSMKEAREFLWRQQTTLCTRNKKVDGEGEESRSSSPVSFKGYMDADDTNVHISDSVSFEHSRNFKKFNLTKKEFFLKSTVQNKKIAVPRKIDISVNYGKPTPWRMLLRPVHPGRSEPLHTSGKKILAF